METDQLSFRSAEKIDIEDIVKIERKDFPDAWSYDSFVSCLTNPFCELIVGETTIDKCESPAEETPADDEAVEDKQIVAYGVMMHMYEQGEIAKVAVDSEYTRRGFATQLVKWMIAIAEFEGVEKIFLDVRESNKAAQALYEKLGFFVYDSTKDFYTTPKEASVKMRYNISHIEG